MNQEVFIWILVFLVVVITILLVITKIKQKKLKLEYKELLSSSIQVEESLTESNEKLKKSKEQLTSEYNLRSNLSTKFSNLNDDFNKLTKENKTLQSQIEANSPEIVMANHEKYVETLSEEAKYSLVRKIVSSQQKTIKWLNDYKLFIENQILRLEPIMTGGTVTEPKTNNSLGNRKKRQKKTE